MRVPAIEVKRHYREPSARETEDIVQAVAELIVDFVKGHRQEEARPAISEPIAAPTKTEENA